ncbi:hypothetical protein GCM10025771_06620 [Niveibacterium umoris]
MALVAVVLLLPVTGADANDHGGGGAAGPAPMPFVVNVGKTGRGGTVLQTQIVLEGANAEANHAIDAYKPQLQHDIIKIIAGQEPEKLRTAEGKTELAEQILASVNKTLGTTRKNGVKEVFFTQFMLQQP